MKFSYVVASRWEDDKGWEGDNLSVYEYGGDIRQAELKGDLGLKWVADFVSRHRNLQENFGFVDFGDVNDIVRSDAVKQFIVAMVRDEKTK